jgi:two-component system response regulator FixJ
MTQTVVHIVDDDEAIRRGLSLLAQSAGHPVLAHASAEAFLDHIAPDGGGCVIADVRMPGMSGLELQRVMRQRGIDLPLIIMTGHGDVPMAVEALKNGAEDFLEKPFDENVFLGSIDKALARGRQVRQRRRLRDEVKRRTDALTNREREVMTLIVEGDSNQMAGSRLGISVRTVENHRARIMDKMQAGSFSELVRMALIADETEEN